MSGWTPSVVVRKMGRSGYMVSVLISAQRLTSPINIAVLDSPCLSDRLGSEVLVLVRRTSLFTLIGRDKIPRIGASAFERLYDPNNYTNKVFRFRNADSTI
jgi:hypothetical protein